MLCGVFLNILYDVGCPLIKKIGIIGFGHFMLCDVMWCDVCDVGCPSN